jgi:precorrin-2 dehydrogenase/sirohydrochlorin ferrochelatase
MPAYYPAFLDVRGRRCLVVGGGAVAERKVTGLLDAGARVRVVSPTLTPALTALAAVGLVEHRARPFRRHDAQGAALVVAATGAPVVDDAVAAAARRARALVNVVDRPAACDFILPSVLRRGDLQIAVSTGGRSPALAREIRRRLEAYFGEESGTIVAWAGRERARVLASAAPEAKRRRAAERLAQRALRRITAAVAEGRLRQHEIERLAATRPVHEEVLTVDGHDVESVDQIG